MKLKSAFITLVFADGSQKVMPLVDVSLRALAPAFDPEVQRLRTLFLAENFDRVGFMDQVYRTSIEARDAFRDSIDHEWPGKKFNALSTLQQCAFAEFEEFHFRQKEGYDSIDREFYTDGVSPP